MHGQRLHMANDFGKVFFNCLKIRVNVPSSFSVHVVSNVSIFTSWCNRSPEHLDLHI